MKVNCCLRVMLTLLHALTGMGAGFFCLYSLIGWNYQAACLPKLVDNFGVQYSIENGLPILCDSLIYGTAVVCLLNFATCLITNCLWQNACVAFISTFLTIIYMVTSVMGGTAIGVYYSVWCNSLERKFVGSTGCEDAAQRYDQYNATDEMSMYKTRMEIQMTSLLALFPVTSMAVLTYLLAMRIFAKPDSRDGEFRYFIHHDEATPLITSDNNSVDSDTTPQVHNHNPPNVAPGSIN